MAFVNEEVPEAEKPKFDVNVFCRPFFGTPTPIVLYRWVIDRERDVFMVRLDGGGPWDVGQVPQPKEYLALSWKGRVTKFDAHYRSRETGSPGGWIGYWTVHDIWLMPPLTAHREEVVGLIREGLEAMGNPSCHRDKLKAVRVSFEPYRPEDWISD